MSIIQISKIQQRSGNLVDLPQLDEAEFGWASDAKRLFIGKTTPNENIEVLTSYSQINYSQINGSVGNLNISNVTVADGQVLTYDGNNWVNRGGDAGGLITLGDVSDVKITGGAIGYVLETDGLGNLSWTPKSSVIAFIQNVTQANPALVTTTQDNFLTDGMEITITNASGMTQLNGNTYYANVQTSNTFTLYSDPSLTTTVNSSGFGEYSYTTATATTASTNRVTVGNSALFAVNQEVLFLGDLSTSGLENNFSYYIKAKPTSTTITVSEELLANGVAGNVKILSTASLTGANVYASGGRAIASVSSGGGGNAAAGSNTTVQFNNSNLLDGDADFTWNFGASPKVLGIVGNANVSNLNATGIVTSSRLTSNIATGTAPLTVTSTTRVANLNVSHSNVSDFEAVTTQNSGTFYPVFVNGATTANYALGSNANISFNAATGNLSTTLLNVIGNANVGNLGTAGLVTATGNVSGGNLTTAGAVVATGNVSGGNLTTAGAVFATGNVSGGNLTTGGVVAATGNVSGGNLTTAGAVFATGNVSGGNLTTAGVLSVTGNANVGNLGTARVLASANVTAPQLISNVATGTAPFVVTSTTQVANLNVAQANVADFISVAAGTGNNFLVFANAATGNVSELTSTGLIANLSNNSITATTFVGALSGAATSATTAGTVTTAAQPNITSVGTLTSAAVTGNVVAGNLYANSGTLGVATLNVSGVSNLNSVGNVRISGGSANQILQTDGAGNLSWTNPNGGYFLHTQVSASTIWTVTHNLNRQYVTVEPIDANGNSYTGRYDYPIINYTNANALTMTFTSAVAGYAAVTGGGTNINSVSVGNSTPGGVNTQVQFNDVGALGGSSGLVYNKTTGTLTATLYAGSGANLTNIAGANVTGAVAFATTANAVAGANVSGTVSSATTAGTVTTAAQPNITSVGTLTSLGVNGTVTAVAFTANTGVFTGNGSGLSAIAGANVSGQVSFAATANAVAGANVTGAVAFATTANAVAGANVSGQVSFAATANAVAGANVSGQVSFAATANAVAGANVTGAVAFATTANAVAGANVSGTVAQATTVMGAIQNNITTLGALTTLSTGANTTAGSITGNWTLTAGSRMQATYADLAEYYEADATYEPGTVLMFGGEKEVTIADDGTSKVAGVVSTNPAYVMNSTCPGLLTAIALQGRVPCKVRGKISKGDMLISGGNGFARPNQFPSMGTVIGKALQDFDGYEGIIEVAVGRL